MAFFLRFILVLFSISFVKPQRIGKNLKQKSNIFLIFIKMWNKFAYLYKAMKMLIIAGFRR